jgi:hypothetical protein
MGHLLRDNDVIETIGADSSTSKGWGTKWGTDSRTQGVFFSFFFFLPRCSHTWEFAPALEHRAEFPQFLNQEQSVGLLGRVISSSQGLYLYTNRE